MILERLLGASYPSKGRRMIPLLLSRPARCRECRAAFHVKTYQNTTQPADVCSNANQRKESRRGRKIPPRAVVLTLLALLVETLAQDEQPCRCLELASGSGSDCWAVTPWLEANGLPLSDCSRYYDSDGGGRGCRIDHDNGDRCDGFSDEPYTPCDPDPADPVLCGGSSGIPTNCVAGSYHAHTRADYGEYSCGSTGDPVDNQDWCEWLANEMIRSVPERVLGRPDPYASSTGYGFWGGSGEWPNDPPGCYVDSYGGMYWNSHPTGTTSSTYAPICYNGCTACPAGWIASSGSSAYCELSTSSTGAPPPPKVDLQVGTGADWCSAWRTERTEHCDIGAFARTLQELRREQALDPRVNRTFELSGAALEDVRSATVRRFSNTDLSLAQVGDDELVGFVFQNVWVPPRAVVTAASIVFSESGESRPHFTHGNLFGERAEGNHGVAPLSEAPGDLSNRTSTDAVVAWELQESDWTDSESAELRTPDISEIVSEIVHQTEWYNGAAMAILFASRVADESRFIALSVALEVSYVSHERRGDLADWAVRGGPGPDRLIDRLPQEIYCPCHAVARRMQAVESTNTEPVPPVAAQCKHADCLGEWSCDASCTRVWIEERPQSGNGMACPSVSPDPCSPGEGECPGDCTGYFEPCTAVCESASSRVWVEQAPVYGAGTPCPLPVACIAGDGGCAG